MPEVDAQVLAGPGVEHYDDDTTWSERLDLAFALIDRLAGAHGLHFGELQAVGIGVVGPYGGRRPDSAQVSWARRSAPDGVHAAFAERFEAPVVVDNNTRLAALAEAVSQPETATDLLYVRLSDGVGGGLVVRGLISRGAHGYAGELGHVSVDPAGTRCRCGKRGCLETVASAPAVLAACRAKGVDVETLDDLAAVVATSDPVADGVLREVGATVGRVLGMAALTLDPDEVVIGGEITRVAPGIVEQAAAALRYELHPLPTEDPLVVRAGRLHDTDGALGALAAAFHLSPLLAGYPLPESTGALPTSRNASPRRAL